MTRELILEYNLPYAFLLTDCCSFLVGVALFSLARFWGVYLVALMNVAEVYVCIAALQLDIPPPAHNSALLACIICLIVIGALFRLSTMFLDQESQDLYY